jgi:hypothetical protein
MFVTLIQRSVFLILFCVLTNTSFAQFDEIMNLLPKDIPDVTNVKLEDRKGWGYSIDKKGNKTILLYSKFTGTGEQTPGGDQPVFGVIQYTNKSMFIGKWRYNETWEGVLLSADGNKAIGGFFAGKKKPKIPNKSVKSIASDKTVSYIPEYGLSLVVGKNEIYFGDYKKSETTWGPVYKKDGSGYLYKDGIFYWGSWKDGKTAGSLGSVNSEGTYNAVNGEQGKDRSYFSYPSDSKYEGASSTVDQCVCFIYKKEESAGLTAARVYYYFLFVRVNDVSGKSKKKIIAAAREFASSEFRDYDYREEDLVMSPDDCQSGKATLLQKNPSAKFASYWTPFSRYDPDRP